MTILNKIISLIPNLPIWDIPLGFQFIEKREFESLLELVDSAIYKTRREQFSDTPSAFYKDLDLEKLYLLKWEVTHYYLQIEGTEQTNENNYEEEFN